MIRVFYGFIFASVLLAGLLWFLLRTGIYDPGAARQVNRVIQPGDMQVPEARIYPSSADSYLRQDLLNYWSARPLPPRQENLMVTAPRILLASLFNETRLEEVNSYIQSLEPRGVSGSSWRLNPYGNYNFTQSALIPMIYFFGDKPGILYPETLKHLVEEMIVEEGDGFNLSVPRTLGLVEDTENHILMTEGTRYLKNKWLFSRGETDPLYDNQENGMEQKLGGYLNDMYKYGVYEFNSDPYLAYTISALLNLEAFAEGEVQTLSRKLLDRMNWEYALGSFNLRRHPPIRRQYDKHTVTAINRDYHSAAMKVWVSFYKDTHDSHLDLAIERGRHVALWAAIMPYRPADKVIDWSMAKPQAYFVKIGRGANSCPEIYSGDPDFLLSAGGANQGRRSLILPRPIILFTHEEETDLTDVFHIMGPGEDFMQWNNTGVYKRFAVAAGPVRVPRTRNPLVNQEEWSVFALGEDHFLVTFSTQNLGIMTICDRNGWDAGTILREMMRQNPRERVTGGDFKQQDGMEISFDERAPNHLWVIRTVNGVEVNRQFESWPAFSSGNL